MKFRKPTDAERHYYRVRMNSDFVVAAVAAEDHDAGADVLILRDGGDYAPVSYDESRAQWSNIGGDEQLVGPAAYVARWRSLQAAKKAISDWLD